ncbi:MAG: TrkA family potassium uptake protein [Desulfuromonadales bacterium]|nr:TrkA family potassium uptake protein [Desulfuromonadales bacterium]NIR33546.1 TrkA family potassium uptake protein [Desulfuromonadales bacterium]NIS41136.1 TrkA family potassium uptake protein [Desulfuromonadales bacterium]
MERTRFVVIGAGNIGLQMLKMLSRDFQLFVVDNNDKALELARQVRGETLQTLKGDATSRLVLEEAQVDKADAVVITTSTEKINIEVARVLKAHFQVPRVLAIGITAAGIEQLESNGVETESIFKVSATGLRNRLTQTTKAVHGVGVEKNEILEVEIHPYSRLAGKPLSRINPRNWRIGIIYRNGNIIVPRGETMLRAKDRVIILGDPKVVQIVAERLSFRFMEFPHEYGDTGFIHLSGGEKSSFIDEVCYLFSILPLKKAVALATSAASEMVEELEQRLKKQQVEEVRTLEINKPLPETVQSAIETTGQDPAILICARETFFPAESFLPGLGRNRQQMEETFRAVACPLLLASGSHPYETVAVPCLSHDLSERSLEAGLEIASAISCSLEALAVKPSSYIASQDEIAYFENIPQTISDLSMVYRGRIEQKELKGNPVKAVLGALPRYQLLITESELEPRGGFLRKIFQPDTSWHIMTRAPISTLVIPPSSIIS